ncbi:hypothetical protein ILP97_00355 [Amycolatopsis sp. H6(2020)]|nr:hypothetical protein [Amycolatopsis sp. H6(2020)]
MSARLDALKVGLSVAVGSGGVVALYLSWRRQHSTEADLDNREHDAAERRLTELYLKAVEQSGPAAGRGRCQPDGSRVRPQRDVDVVAARTASAGD